MKPIYLIGVEAGETLSLSRDWMEIRLKSSLLCFPVFGRPVGVHADKYR
jgi:hypothetical protein